MSCTQLQSRGGVSLLLRIGNPAKRERALTSAYKLLVDISSVTSLPAMCRLVSAVWWMVPPAPPVSLLSSHPSRRALPQIVAQTYTSANHHPYAPQALCIRDSLRESFWRGRIIERCDTRAQQRWHLFFLHLLSLRKIRFSRETFNSTLQQTTTSFYKKKESTLGHCSNLQ